MSAFEQAREMYRKLGKGYLFNLDLKHYLANGVVICRPDIFVMCRVVEAARKGEEKKLTWDVRCAVGDLRRLLNAAPAYFPNIQFGRRFKPTLKIYSFDRLVRLANKMGAN